MFWLKLYHRNPFEHYFASITKSEGRINTNKLHATFLLKKFKKFQMCLTGGGVSHKNIIIHEIRTAQRKL